MDIFTALRGGIAFGKGKKGGKAPPKPATAPIDEDDDDQRLRKKHRIHVVGDHVEPPLRSFQALEPLGAPPWLRQNLLEHQRTQPTAIQMQAIPSALKRGHLICAAPTGSGKTLAFLLPILTLLRKPLKEQGVSQGAVREGAVFRALVVDPTRELAMQTVREFKLLVGKKGFRARILDKLVGKEQNVKWLDVAISTPARLVSMLKAEQVSLRRLEHLVMDEADKLLDFGFVEQLDDILSFCPAIKAGTVQLMVFSATMPPGVMELCKSIMHSYTRVTIGADHAATSDVKQELQYVGREDGKLVALRQLRQQRRFVPPCLIFVQSRKRAEELFDELVYEKLFVGVIHSQKTQAQRDATVKAFREGQLWVLICTDLLGRGIDFKGVELVINYDIPRSGASYIHRVGRTGRAGHAGTAITLVTEDDEPYLRSIVSVMRNSGCEVPEWMLGLRKLRKREAQRAEQRPPKRRRISTKLRQTPEERQAQKAKGAPEERQADKAKGAPADA